MLPVQPSPTLDQLLEDARRGEVGAFNELVVLHQRQLYNVCFRTLGNAEDAADATQDAFLSAYRALGSFKGSAAGLRAWLIRIAINNCYDQLRRRQRRPADSLDQATANENEPEGDAAERLADPAANPEQRALTAETARHIQDAIDQLPPEQRLTVVLCDVQGLSYEEAAAAMSIELGTVKSRLSRARGQLRTLLTEKGELPGRRARLEGERNS
jgi:RNA polymerase sigma-70 factor (ECF subfamily)